MACTSVATMASTAGLNEVLTKMRRSRSEPQLVRCSSVKSTNTAATSATTTKMRTSRSVPMLFPFNFSVANAFRTLLFSDEQPSEMELVDGAEIEEEEEENLGEELPEKRATNWIETILELRTKWRRDQMNGDGEEEDQENNDYNCGVHYDSESEMEEEDEERWDPVKFRKFLSPVTWPEMRVLAKLAFLCNMAYVISEIKEEDISSIYKLQLVTSSLEKKAEAAMKANTHVDPANPNLLSNELVPKLGSKRVRPNSSVAYEIAASAASYVSSRAKGLLSLGSGGANDNVNDRVYKSEVAAYVAAGAMTAVVAAEDEARLEAAKSLQSLHSSPCEWFVVDDPSTGVRCFVIQGSDSLSSWQANLLFEPTKFEKTEVLVHRGIYEAAKGIYEQFLPEIQSQLKLYGDGAKFRFTGHSLGGSLAMLVNLMLLSRREVPASCLLPVVTFGSPSVFCGGHNVLDVLGLDENHIRSVVMHRDIVPRAFSCSYPDQIAQLLKRLNGTFRSHPCLNSEKLLYSPLGKILILQPDAESSPHHPLLPSGAALYSLETKDATTGKSITGSASALKAFLNHPHPLHTLSDPTAYGSEGTILRDHDSSNYLKAVNELVREKNANGWRRSRKHNYWLPNLTRTRSSHVPWESHRNSAKVATGV